MPYIKKEELTKRTKKKTFVFDDFQLYRGGENSLIASESMNCDCRDGVLSYGIGVKPYLLAGESKPVYKLDKKLRAAHLVNTREDENSLRAKEYLFITTEDGSLYYYNRYIELLNFIFQGYTVSARGKWTRKSEPYIYFFGTQNSIMQKDWNGEVIYVSVRDLGLSRVCNDRVFYSFGQQNVKYSSLEGTFDDYSIDKAGVLYGGVSDGEIRGLAVIGKDLYVFFNKIIKKVRVEGSTLDFDFETIPYLGKKIYFNTVCECDDGIFFLAEDGVYRFDGKRAGQVCEHLAISPATDDMTCVGANANGEYVLAYTDKNGTRKQAVISADGKSGYFSVPVEGLTENGKVALFRKGDYICTFDKNSLCIGRAYFQTEKLSFGQSGRKTLQRLRFFGHGVADVRLQGNGWERVQRVTFEEGEFVWEIWGKSDEFSLEIELEQGSQIRKIAAEVIFP